VAVTVVGGVVLLSRPAAELGAPVTAGSSAGSAPPGHSG
jgi:hypothetical protein